MCWIGTNNSIVAMGKTAMEDITVYKVMKRKNGRLYSYMQGYRYEAGKEYTLGKELRYEYDNHDCETYKIDEGFHSYGAECDVYIERDRCFVCTLRMKPKYGIYEDFQAYLNYGTIVIVKCVIPKGSIYFKNTGGEIVSDKIRITDEIVSYDGLIDESPYKVVNFQDIFHK